MSGRLLRLYPLPAKKLVADRLYEDLELLPPGHRDPSRPYVVINMVSSVDGRVAAGGKASPLGSETDRRAMRTLRAKVDAVMIGANTLRAERLSLGLDETAECGRAQPLAVIITETGDLPLESNLVGCGRQKVLVITPDERAERFRGRASVLPAATDPSGAVDLGEALRKLRAYHGVRILLVEGGPSLNHALISHRLADELFLTISPKLLGGPPRETLTMLNGPLLPADARPAPALLSIHLADSELFLRYSLSRVGELTERLYHD